MNKKTYTLICELGQLSIVIIAIIVLSIGFWILSRWLKPRPLPDVENMQIEEMQRYHRSEGKMNLIFFE